MTPTLAPGKALAGPPNQCTRCAFRFFQKGNPIPLRLSHTSSHCSCSLLSQTKSALTRLHFATLSTPTLLSPLAPHTLDNSLRARTGTIPSVPRAFPLPLSPRWCVVVRYETPIRISLSYPSRSRPSTFRSMTRPLSNASLKEGGAASPEPSRCGHISSCRSGHSAPGIDRPRC